MTEQPPDDAHLGRFRWAWWLLAYASLALGLVGIVLVLMWKRFDGVPMSVLVIYPFALSALLGAPRLLYRAWKDYQALQSDVTARRVLILGAGIAGLAAARAFMQLGISDVHVLDLADAPKMKSVYRIIQSLSTNGTKEKRSPSAVLTVTVTATGPPV